jgi:hypothetical protein
MYAQEMNGYSIIASAIIDHSRGVIMGEGYRDNTLVYVVSELDHPDNAPDYWHNGTYFDGPDTLRNQRDAHARFLTILSAGWSVEEDRREEMRRNAATRRR